MAEDIIKEDIAQEGADLSVFAPAEEQESSIEIETDDAETQVYEVGFHIVPSVEENDLAEEVSAIKSLIEKREGVFVSDEAPKLINLAYTIAKDIEGKKYKFNTAYFGWIKFEMNTNNIAFVKEGMDANKNILRYLIIKTVKESTLVPKTAMFTKSESSKKSKVKLKSEQNKEEVKKKTPISEEDLDKTIEELIVE